VSWARLDDRFHDNRKVKRLWRRNGAALALHVMAIAYCAGNETDGLVDHEFVLEKVPAVRDRDPMTTALVETGFWTVEDDGWRIHDFLDYNPSRASLNDKREADAERKRRVRTGNPTNVRQTSARTPNGRTPDVQPDSARSPVRVLAESAPRARAVPSRPDLTPPVVPQGGRRRDNDRYDREVVAYAASLLPNVPQDYARGAVRVALEQLHNQDAEITNAKVLELAGRYRPLPAEIRELIAEAAKVAA
jgi:hypothetical protein